ncbi:hypothetical protein K1W54_19210 [Micromonospora sp. CPCC 205371]|nr:hypothetical protein [Micromonospora sp. CPCC 205371]
MTGRTEHGAYQTESERTGWAGWIIFAGLMMIVIGLFQLVAGSAALFDDGYFLVTSDGLLLNLGYTAWGWIHLILGIVAIIVGYGVMVGQTWARVVGILFGRWMPTRPVPNAASSLAQNLWAPPPGAIARSGRHRRGRSLGGAGPVARTVPPSIPLGTKETI